MKRTHSERAKFWQQHIDTAKSFPGSAQQYCDEHELESSSFYQWRKRLSGSQSLKKSDFLPVVVATERTERPSDPVLPNAQWVAEVMVYLLRGLA